MHTSNNLHSIMYHENNFQSPIRTYQIIGLHEQWVIFHVLEWYSTNKIPFCHSRLWSITCHFLVNNLHFITYSNHNVQPHWKEFTWNRMRLIVNFPCSSPMFWLNPIASQFLVNNLHFSCISCTEGKVQKGNNQSRSSLWNVILLSCSMYLEVHLLEIAIYLWWRFIGDTTKFQFAFCSKLGGTLFWGN